MSSAFDPCFTFRPESMTEEARSQGLVVAANPPLCVLLDDAVCDRK